MEYFVDVIRKRKMKKEIRRERRKRVRALERKMKRDSTS